MASGRAVAAGQAGAAGGDDGVDGLVGDPLGHDGADAVAVVGFEEALVELVACRCDALGEQRAGVVGFKRAAVGDGQHGDIEG